MKIVLKFWENNYFSYCNLLKLVYKMCFDHMGLDFLANTHNMCNSVIFQVSTL